METMEYTGFDAELEEEKVEAPAEESKRRPYATWTVDGKEYKLKLTASVITRLEERYKRNLLFLVSEDGMPPVSVMLTIIQAAMQAYHHGVTFQRVQSMYDVFVDEGGDQQALLGDVILPILSVSGFFTQNQMDVLTKEIKETDNL